MDDIVLPPNPGGSRTTTFSSDVHIIENINTHPTNLPPTAVSFTTQTAKQDKTPSLSPVPTIQVGQDITHIDSNGTRFPATITKVMI